MEKKDILIVRIKENLIEPNQRKEYEDMGYDPRFAYLLPFKFEARFRCLIETLKNFTDKSDGGKNFDICYELNFEIAQLCKSLVYLINSTSYMKGQKYYEFDKMEINSKLRRKTRR